MTIFTFLEKWGDTSRDVIMDEGFWEKEGLLIKDKKGNLSVYQVNKRYPFLPELKKIFKKSFGIEIILREKLKGIKGLKMAVIFGSYAKDKLSAESDIDLLLIGSHDSLEAIKKILDMEEQFGREINIVDMTEKEFEKKAESLINAFAAQISSNPSSYSQLLIALDFAIGPSKEFVISGENQTAETTEAIRLLYQKFIPNKVVAFRPADSRQAKEIISTIPFLAQLKTLNGKTETSSSSATATSARSNTQHWPMLATFRLKN